MTSYADTWRLKSDSASWDYELAYTETTTLPPSNAYAQFLQRFLTICQGFAIPTEVRITTLSQGEDAYVFDVCNPVQRGKLNSIMMTHDDIDDIEISLTLVYEPVTGEEDETVPAGATVWLQREDSPDDRSSPFRLLVSLDADLYAFVSWGNQRDNALLAARNAPRLEAFLHRIEDELGGILRDIDAPSYEGQVYRYGFRPPS